MTEVLAPTMIDYARPSSRPRWCPPLLRGDETWCQGFSEPGTGSNLASLSCRAVRTDDGWRVTGQKVWTSLAQYAQRCVLLTRTGTVGVGAPRASPRCSSTWTRPASPCGPIETMHGAPEFCEVFFDDVLVPFDRTLGDEGQGWAVAMDLLPYERSTALWHRAAFLHRRLQDLLDAAAPGALDPDDARRGDAAALRVPRPVARDAAPHGARRARSGRRRRSTRCCWPRPSRRCSTSSPTRCRPRSPIGDDADERAVAHRVPLLAAATIYGGSAEIQRNIIARRLLDLGDDR